MEKIQYFFSCYFHQNEDLDNLANIIQDYKQTESLDSTCKFITELHQIITGKSYLWASRIMHKFGGRSPNLSQTEQLIKYIYNKLIDKPAYLNMKDFTKDCKVIFCPVCCPDLKKAQPINLIDKATITEKNRQIYICKPCKLVWLTEDIRADNAQDYKKFMKSIGLKGFWNELSNIDIL